MDLGIAGKHAIVCAASKGLGRACAFALAREGVNLVICARRVEPLQQTADEIRQSTGVDVVAITADITTPAGREQVLSACPNPDILINNAGGPPPGDFRDWTRDDWIKALDANMLTAIELIKATVDGMIARRFGRIVNITSAAVKAPIDILGLSNGARSGLTGFVAGVARKTVRHNVTINNLLPGQFDTDRLRRNFETVVGDPIKSPRVSVDHLAGEFAGGHIPRKGARLAANRDLMTRPAEGGQEALRGVLTRLMGVLTRWCLGWYHSRSTLGQFRLGKVC